MTTIQTIPSSPATITTPAPRAALRSLGAVVGGLVATFVLTTAIDLALHATKVFPAFGERMSDALFVLAFAYRIPLDIAGAYLAARWAPSNPRVHALALGVIGLVLSTVGAITMWEYGPAWYSLGNIAIALPCAWAGAHLLETRRSS